MYTHAGFNSTSTLRISSSLGGSIETPSAAISNTRTFSAPTQVKLTLILSRRTRGWWNYSPRERKLVTGCVIFSNSLLFCISHQLQYQCASILISIYPLRKELETSPSLHPQASYHHHICHLFQSTRLCFAQKLYLSCELCNGRACKCQFNQNINKSNKSLRKYLRN